MGTRAIVKFKNSKSKTLLAVEHCYDGYLEGVGQGLLNYLENFEIKNGLSGGEELHKHANGIEDLALQYVLKAKYRVGGLYAAYEEMEAEYNYTVTYENDKFYIHVDEFKGDLEEFQNYINSKEEE